MSENERRSWTDEQSSQHRIYAHDLADLATVLQVTIAYFFEDDNVHEEEEGKGQNDLTDSEQTLLFIFRDLGSQPAQDFAVKVLRELRHMTLQWVAGKKRHKRQSNLF